MDYILYICNMEILKDIAGFEGLYQASSLGKIKSLVKRSKNVNYLKEGVTKAGYKMVTLCKNKKRYTKSSHRLIAEAFYGLSKNDVNHKDGNKLNNNIENLEYVTKSENTKHAINTGLFKPNYTKIAIESRKKVAQIDVINNNILMIYESSHEAARQTGFNRGNISTCCRQNKIMYNYKWQYL
jgi:hypothetical protein